MSTVQFTALIRLPFARGDFIDPPQVNWDATKDRALWKVISKSSQTKDLNWDELAATFEVTPKFILQQAAWLYERHLDHVRTQVKKVGGVASTAGTLGLGSTHVASPGVPMARTASGGSGSSREYPPLSLRGKDTQNVRSDSSTPKPPLSRNPSTTTVTQSRVQKVTSNRDTSLANRRPSQNIPHPSIQPSGVFSSRLSPNALQDQDSPPASPSSSPSSSSGSDEPGPTHRSQLFKRPPRFNASRPRESLLSDDGMNESLEDRDSNGSLPFANISVVRPTSRVNRVGESTMAESVAEAPPPNSRRARKDTTTTPEPRLRGGTVTGAGAEGASPKRTPTGGTMSPPTPQSGPLSPLARPELARLGQRGTPGKGKKEGSEGTPSMGSSFSDIDDVSIAQSALEEALLSNMQHGRMSTLSQLRSRYL